MKRAGRNARRSRARAPHPQDVDRKIIQIIPADPRWHALYAEAQGPATTPLVCFALVEFQERGETPMRLVCPMVLHEDGAIEDVAYRDGFVDLIPPCLHHSANSDHEPNEPDDASSRAVDSTHEVPRA